MTEKNDFLAVSMHTERQFLTSILNFRQLLLSVPCATLSITLRALPGLHGRTCHRSPLCKDLLLNLASAASWKLLHAASLTDLARFIQFASLVHSLIASAVRYV